MYTHCLSVSQRRRPNRLKHLMPKTTEKKKIFQETTTNRIKDSKKHSDCFCCCWLLKFFFVTLFFGFTLSLFIAYFCFTQLLYFICSKIFRIQWLINFLEQRFSYRLTNNVILLLCTLMHVPKTLTPFFPLNKIGRQVNNEI